MNRKIIGVIIITLSIIFIVAAVLMAIGIITWSRVVRPPEVPNIPISTPSATTPAYMPANPGNNVTRPNHETDDEMEEEDPPQAQYEVRKPMFFTFLIVGLTERYNANTIMVASFDSEAQQGHIISIPRDTAVTAQRANSRIGTAYPAGRLHGGHDGGIERLKQEVQTIVGFRPDFYIRIDYEAFRRMVDAVGGVEVTVPFHMVYDDPYQNLHINIPAGRQILNGHNALHFARYRMGNDPRHNITDYRRIEHQQMIISALFRELLTPATLLRIPEFMRIFNDHFSSNLAYGELVWLADQVRRIGGMDALQFHTAPTLGTTGAPQWFELPDEAGILELVNRTVNPLVRDLTTDDVDIVR